MPPPATPDRYADWLGVPPGPRPPDHYAVLGLDRFEADVAVIQKAATERTQKLRSLCTKYPAEATELINVVTKARLCLTDPEDRAAYELQFREPVVPPTDAEPTSAEPEGVASIAEPPLLPFELDQAPAPWLGEAEAPDNPPAVDRPLSEPTFLNQWKWYCRVLFPHRIELPRSASILKWKRTTLVVAAVLCLLLVGSQFLRNTPPQAVLIETVRVTPAVVELSPEVDTPLIEPASDEPLATKMEPTSEPEPTTSATTAPTIPPEVQAVLDRTTRLAESKSTAVSEWSSLLAELKSASAKFPEHAELNRALEQSQRELKSALATEISRLTSRMDLLAAWDRIASVETEWPGLTSMQERLQWQRELVMSARREWTSYVAQHGEAKAQAFCQRLEIVEALRSDRQTLLAALVPPTVPAAKPAPAPVVSLPPPRPKPLSYEQAKARLAGKEGKPGANARRHFTFQLQEILKVRSRVRIADVECWFAIEVTGSTTLIEGYGPYAAAADLAEALSDLDLHEKVPTIRIGCGRTAEAAKTDLQSQKAAKR